MTAQSGGTVSGYPGVASDGSSGLIVAGSLSVSGGDPTEAPTDGTPFTAIAGYTVLRDAPGNVTGGWPSLEVHQQEALAGHTDIAPALGIYRYGDMGGGNYQEPMLLVEDDTAGTGVFFVARQGGTRKFTVDKAGGVKAAGGIGQFDHVAPTVQPTFTLSTSTITDPDALAAIQALISILNGSGAAAITET